LKDFGVKVVNGKNMLSGPGTYAGENASGVTIGGLQWIRKTAEFCGEMVGESSEDEIYNTWAKSGSVDDLRDSLCQEMCQGHTSEEL